MQTLRVHRQDSAPGVVETLALGTSAPCQGELAGHRGMSEELQGTVEKKSKVTVADCSRQALISMLSQHISYKLLCTAILFMRQ